MAGSLFKTKPVRKIIQGFARNRTKDPMEMKFREAGHFRQFLQFHLAIQIPAKIVDDPINSLGIFAVGPGLLAWHGSDWHCVAENNPNCPYAVNFQIKSMSAFSGSWIFPY